MPEFCALHPWSPAVALSRFDDRTPICALCLDAEMVWVNVKDFEREMRGE